MNQRESFKKGFLEMLVLEVLSRGDCYGYEIAQTIKEKSNNYISVLVSSLYPVLYRMEANQWVSSYRKKSGIRMERVYYHLEEAGKLELEEQRKVYFEMMEAIYGVLSREHNMERSEKIS